MDRIRNKKGTRSRVSGKQLLANKSGKAAQKPGAMANSTRDTMPEERICETRTRTLLNIPYTVSMLIFPDGVCLEVSENLAQRFGKVRSNFIGKPIWDFLPPDTAAQRQFYVDQAVKTKKTVRFEDERLGIWNDSIVSPILDDKGNVFEVAVIAVDITERKRVEEALKERDKRLDALFNHQLVGMVITSPEKGWLDANDTWCHMIGYSREELARLDWALLTHPDDLPADMAQFNRILSGEINQYTLQKRFIRKDGAILHTEISVGCVRRSDGFPEYIVGLATDITERKRLEAEIGLRSEILFQMAEGTNMVRSSDNKIIFTNPSFDRMFGYGPGELIGKNISIINAPTLKDPVQTANEIRRALTAEGSWHGELQNVKKDGSTFWSATNVFSFEHREFGRVFISIHTDITESKRIEAALRESEERFRNAIIGAPLPVIIHAEDGEILAISNILTTLTGYAHEDIRTMSMWTDKVFGQKSQEMYEYIQKLFDRDCIDEGGEYDITTKSGRTLTWYFKSNPLGKLPDGRKLLICMALDITERKRMEEERIERKGAERAMNKVLMEIHDGIGGITTNITMLSEVAKKATKPEDAEKALNTISDLARDGMVEIRGLMYSLDREDLNWRSLVVEMRNQGTKLLEPHAIKFTMTSDIEDNIQNPGSHLCLNLFRIYREALMNVIKHAKATEVMASFHVDKEHLVLRIRDDGKGFEKSALMGSGRGVGNMAARASSMHGRVAITGDRGTCVTIEIPV